MEHLQLQLLLLLEFQLRLSGSMSLLCGCMLPHLEIRVSRGCSMSDGDRRESKRGSLWNISKTHAIVEGHINIRIWTERRPWSPPCVARARQPPLGCSPGKRRSYPLGEGRAAVVAGTPAHRLPSAPC